MDPSLRWDDRKRVPINLRNKNCKIRPQYLLAKKYICDDPQHDKWAKRHGILEMQALKSNFIQAVNRAQNKSQKYRNSDVRPTKQDTQSNRELQIAHPHPPPACRVNYGAEEKSAKGGGRRMIIENIFPQAENLRVTPEESAENQIKFIKNINRAYFYETQPGQRDI